MQNWKTYLLSLRDLVAMALAFSAFGALASLACTAASQTAALKTAANAGQLREMVCAYVAIAAPGTPELERVAQLCAAGAQLRELASAYARCETEPPPLPPTPAPAAPVRNPWPDASTDAPAD